MRFIISTAAMIAMLLTLASCQYFDFNSHSANQQTDAGAVCIAMGHTRGNAEYDWCVAAEEEARKTRGY